MIDIKKWALGGVLTIGMLISGSAAFGQNPPPTRLAVVNIVKVFSALDEKAKGDKELEDMAKNLNTQKTAKEKDVETARSTLEQLKTNSKAYVEAQDDLLSKATDLETFSRYIERKLQIEQRTRTIRIYKDINDAIATMSKQRGIALVLVEDEMSLGDAQSQSELLSRISIRKVIYADESLDITRDVIKQMNSAAAP